MPRPRCRDCFRGPRPGCVLLVKPGSPSHRFSPALHPSTHQLVETELVVADWPACHRPEQGSQGSQGRRGEGGRSLRPITRNLTASPVSLGLLCAGWPLGLL